MLPDRMRAGRPNNVPACRPIIWMSFSEPSEARALRTLWNSGMAKSTPVTERTRFTSVSRRALVSLTCWTRASTTQMGARMLRMCDVVQESRPWNTAFCCVMSSAEKVRPPTSIRYFERSPSNMRSAR